MQLVSIRVKMAKALKKCKGLEGTMKMALPLLLQESNVRVTIMGFQRAARIDGRQRLRDTGKE
jgi:hypothetical protein